jgi:hypothetical protein
MEEGRKHKEMLKERAVARSKRAHAHARVGPHTPHAACGASVRVIQLQLYKVPPVRCGSNDVGSWWADAAPPPRVLLALALALAAPAPASSASATLAGRCASGDVTAHGESRQSSLPAAAGRRSAGPDTPPSLRGRSLEGSKPACGSSRSNGRSSCTNEGGRGRQGGERAEETMIPRRQS